MIFRAGTICLWHGLAALLLSLQSATGAAASPPPAPIWSGVYVGIHGGYASGDMSYTFEAPHGPVFDRPENFNHNSSDWFGGAHAGVQHQFRHFVVGLELSYSDLNLSDTAYSKVEPGSFRQVDVNSLFVVGPRLGYATDRWMAYVKGGYASADVDTRANKYVGGVTTSSRESGWMMGAGLELLCWRGLVLGVDYSYVRLDIDDRVGLSSDKKPVTYTDADSDIHTVSLRLSYLFGGPRETLHDPLK